MPRGSDVPGSATARNTRRISVLALIAIATFTCSARFADAAPLPPTTNEDCAVSVLLVPTCGAWLGASTPSSDGSYNYTTGLNEYLSVAQNVPDIIHFYKTGASTFPTSGEVAMSERDGRQVSLLYYNWKPSPSLTWAQIAAGAADDNVRVVAGLKAYPGRLFPTIHHEPENDQSQLGAGRTPTDYVAMYRHVVTMLRAEGVTNVVFVMNYMGFSKWSSVADDFYPGDDVVDWIAYDPYGFAGQPTFDALLNQPTNGWPGFYDWAVGHAPGKPIMLGEWGFDLSTQPSAPAALDGAADIIAADFPSLKALVYWNDRTEIDYRLDQPGTLGAEYGASYSRMANAAYFNSTDVTAIDESLTGVGAGVGVGTPPPPTVAVEPPAPGAGNGILDPPPEIPEFPVPVAATASAVLLGGLVVRRRMRPRSVVDTR